MAKANVASKEDVLEAISQMSVMDLVELISEMEEKFGVTAAAPVAVAAAPAAGDSAEAAGEEQSEFEGESKANKWQTYISILVVSGFFIWLLITNGNLN